MCGFSESNRRSTHHQCKREQKLKCDAIYDTQGNTTMSSLRKSASFRSRIPVRRIKPQPRRCYSPQSTGSSSKREQFYVTEHQLFEQALQQNRRNDEQSDGFGKRSGIWLAAADDSSHRYSSSSYSSSDESDDSSDASPTVSFFFLFKVI